MAGLSMSVRIYCDDGHEQQRSEIARFTRVVTARTGEEGRVETVSGSERWAAQPDRVIERRMDDDGREYERAVLECPHPRCQRNLRARMAKLTPVLDRLEHSMWGGSGILSYKGISLRRLAATLESK